MTSGEISAPTQRAGWVYTALKPLCRILTTVLFDLKVWGVHHVPRRGGVLLISNHQSYLDPVLVTVRLPRSASFFAKSELFVNRFFAWLIRSLGAFPVRLGSSDREAMREAIGRLEEGHVLNVYPEGTRTETGELSPIQAGVALMVQRANVPVVPVVIIGAYEAWPLTRKLFRPSPIRVMYGPALQLHGLDRRAVVELIGKTFREMLQELRDRSARL